MRRSGAAIPGNADAVENILPRRNKIAGAVAVEVVATLQAFAGG